ncbi:hypothetical protein REPUB_Repub13aG0038900 [Reevesia pubescens]
MGEVDNVEEIETCVDCSPFTSQNLDDNFVDEENATNWIRLDTLKQKERELQAKEAELRRREEVITFTNHVKTFNEAPPCEFKMPRRKLKGIKIVSLNAKRNDTRSNGQARDDQPTRSRLRRRQPGIESLDSAEDLNWFTSTSTVERRRGRTTLKEIWEMNSSKRIWPINPAVAAVDFAASFSDGSATLGQPCMQPVQFLPSSL